MSTLAERPLSFWAEVAAKEAAVEAEIERILIKDARIAAYDEFVRAGLLTECEPAERALIVESGGTCFAASWYYRRLWHQSVRCAVADASNQAHREQTLRSAWFHSARSE